jgi:hypothetical protein
VPINDCRSGSLSVGINASCLDDRFPLGDFRVQILVEHRRGRPVETDRFSAELERTARSHGNLLTARAEQWASSDRGAGMITENPPLPVRGCGEANQRHPSLNRVVARSE